MREDIADKIDWKKVNGLVPAVIQNYQTFEVLMLGFLDKEALRLTLKNNKVYFFSRTKQRIWMKGEESGDFLEVESVALDCDNDTLLIMVKPRGSTCHLGNESCFGEIGENFLYKLERKVQDRISVFSNDSYVCELNNAGINKIAQKVGEEATEVVIAAIGEPEKIVDEASDLLFHLLILLNKSHISIAQVLQNLKKRHNKPTS